ncbi:molybdenum cofactor biosynthesis protein MoaE [Alphaproteobacteria bacterium]|nr:molybdenum cofactor biosynthesis protein MoaE [Alphaproteobacteria bacterium]
MILITKEDFNLEEEFKKIHSKRNGAYSFFLGTVRQDIDENIDGIFLECYEDLAAQQLNKIREYSIKKWKLNDCVIIHRIGELQISDRIVLVITASPHRSDCIEACEYIIDSLKANVALWKFHTKENQRDEVAQKKKDIDKYLSWDEVIS